MIREACRRFTWGLLLILLDFRLGGFDLLPDVIGWLLLYSGLSLVREEKDAFQKAGRMAIPMALLSLVTLYNPPAEPGTVWPAGPLGVWSILLGIVYLVLTLWTVYQLFQGIMGMAEAQGNRDLEEEIRTRGLQYVGLQIATLAAFGVVFIPVLGVVYLLGVLFGSVVLTVLILRTMIRSGRELDGGRTEVEFEGGDLYE